MIIVMINALRRNIRAPGKNENLLEKLGGFQMNQAMARIYEAVGCKTQNELASVLSLTQSSISDAIKRQSVPSDWLIKLLRLKGINPEWILHGIGAKYLIPTDSITTPPSVVYNTKVKPPRECSAQELIDELVRRALMNTEGELPLSSSPSIDYDSQRGFKM